MATTAEPSSLSTERNDCLLHGEHHVFDTDCWDHFVTYYRRLQCLFPSSDHEALMARYSLEYEAKALHNLLKETRD